MTHDHSHPGVKWFATVALGRSIGMPQLLPKLEDVIEAGGRREGCSRQRLAQMCEARQSLSLPICIQVPSAPTTMTIFDANLAFSL